MPDKEIKFVPARYVGQNRIGLHSPVRNSDGSRRITLDLSPGDVILMPEYEVVGYTLLFDLQGNNAPRDLGAGRRILPEHLEFKDNERELSVHGYEFHSGRPDFELVEVTPPEESSVAPVESKQAKGGKA